MSKNSLKWAENVLLIYTLHYYCACKLEIIDLPWEPAHRQPTQFTHPSPPNLGVFNLNLVLGSKTHPPP